MSDVAADPVIEGPGKRRFTFVWLFPLLAVGVALFLLWREFEARGPLVSIQFPTANGLVAGETVLRYRSVDVGRLESLRFNDDLSRVIADVRVTPEVAAFIDADAEFWIVRPEVTVRGITGLETVLSGVYIEGQWDAEQGPITRNFIARAEPPLTPADAPGVRVTLRAADGGSLNVGAPILFRGIEVGRVESRRLTDDGAAVEFGIFISAPNDARVTKDARFWNVSGVNLNFGAEGAQLRVASLATLIQGGAAFDDLSQGDAEPVEDGHVFDLYASETTARAQALETDPGAQLLLEVYFGGSIRGLAVGAVVEYQGIPIGRVARIGSEVDPQAGTFATLTTIAISPRRLGLEEGDVDGALTFLDKAVEQGVRAQLATGNLLTGQLLVRLVKAQIGADADPAVIERRDDRPARFPSTASDLDELAGSVEGVLKRVDQLPIEQLFANAVLLLENVNTVIGSEEMREAPARAVAALTALETLLTSEGVAGAPAEAQAVLRTLREQIESDEMQTAIADLGGLLKSASAVAQSLEADDFGGESAAAVAALRARLEDPALAAMASEIASAAAAAEAFLASPALSETPAALNETLASLRTLLDAPGLDEAPAELAASLAAARKLLEELEEQNAAGEIAAAAAAARGLLDDPALRRAAESTANAAAALTAALGADEAERLPEAASRALESTADLFDQLRDANLAATAAETLRGIERAGAAVERALAEAPTLIARLATVSQRADGMLASLDVGSELNYETVTAIREIRDAARAITDLAELVERQPNALILGR